MRDDHPCDRASELPQQQPDKVTPPATNDVATQSVLLALIAQPLATSDTTPPVPTPEAGQVTTAMESVMPSVMEDGASVPVTAADSSKAQQIESTEKTDKIKDFTAPTPSGATLSATVDAKGQPIVPLDEDGTLNSQAQPTAGELRDLQRDQPTIPLTAEKPAQVSEKTEANTPPAALLSQPLPEEPKSQETIKTIATSQDQRPYENRPAAPERPVAKQDAPEHKEEVAPRHMSVTPQAWQDSTNQDRESGMEWSGRDHRERFPADQISARPVMAEGPTPTAPSNPALVVNGVDQRAFSSAPSVKMPTDVHPTATVPPVQPTDWMPGSSASQTKSMVLELSQADLGRVNIRVAVNQDVVHTHFSSDRNDMGQYLQNGQDKLQSALQMSGLDLGRFQVDIDRQSAGRSFQQSASQGQSSNHSRQEESQNSGRGREELTPDAGPRRGMLNLVA
jgi:flagellar hook-length control protein FliK